MLIGYARVSTFGQNEDLQINALEKEGCERIYVDHSSGAKASRPQLDRMLEALREGDTVMVWKLDRLGCSFRNLVNLMELFHKQKVGFRSLTEPIDTTTPSGVLVFNIFSAMAQFEYDLTRERTIAGLKAARAHGREGGRPYKLSCQDIAVVRRLYDSKTMTVKEIADKFGVCRSTVYKAVERAKRKERLQTDARTSQASESKDLPLS